MSKLLQRLSDASKSGVYRTSRSDEILAAARGSTLHVARIDLAAAADKDAVLARFAQALSFPKWFGGNWDALEDCLGDLSWRPGEGHVLVLEDFELGDELGILLDVLASVAEFWAARGQPFFAVFVDPQRRLALAELFRER